MKMERILVPIDFSDFSRAALRAADDLAASRDAELQLLHVYPLMTVAVLEFSYVEPPAEIVHATSAAQTELERWSRELRTPANRIRIDVTTGDPVAELIKRSESVDLLVMATHGRSGMSRFLLGSVTERVVRAAHCSVLVVRSS